MGKPCWRSRYSQTERTVDSGGIVYPNTPWDTLSRKAANTSGGDSKSMSATQNGSTSVPLKRSHFKLPVPCRLISLSNSMGFQWSRLPEILKRKKTGERSVAPILHRFFGQIMPIRPSVCRPTEASPRYPMESAQRRCRQLSAQQSLSQRHHCYRTQSPRRAPSAFLLERSFPQ